MNYFEEYTNKLESLRNGEKTKINIHFIVSEPLSSFCIKVNQDIKKHDFGFINMDATSIIFPHISLCMGFVDNYEMLEKIFVVVDSYAKSLSPFTLDATNMYFKSLTATAPKYLFIDSLQNEFLMEQKKILHNQLQDIIYPNDWDMKNERAHITVGCYKNVTSKIEDIVNSYNIIPSCKVSQIGISISGKKGVCLSLLKVIDL